MNEDQKMRFEELRRSVDGQDDDVERRMKNLDRAYRGQQVILEANDEPELALIDLLIDVHHWADAIGLDFASAARRAKARHGKEVVAP